MRGEEALLEREILEVRFPNKGFKVLEGEVTKRELEGGGLEMFCQERAEESWVGDQAAHNRSRIFFFNYLRVKTPVVMISGIGGFFFQGSTPIFPLPI